MDLDSSKLDTKSSEPKSSALATPTRLLRHVGVAACLESASGWLATMLVGLLVLIGILFVLQRIEGKALHEARTEIILQDLQEQMEADLLIGLDLGDSSRASEMLATAMSRDKEILAVEIFDTAGVSLFNTDRGSIGEQVPRDWFEATQRKSSGGKSIALSTNGVDLVRGIEIKGPFGEISGHIGLTSKPVELPNLVAFLWTSFAVFSLALVVSCVFVYFKLHAHIRDYDLKSEVQRIADRIAATQSRLDQTLKHLADDLDGSK